jgi:hypothetical protein
LNADACLAFAVQKNGAGGCLIGQNAAATWEDFIKISHHRYVFYGIRSRVEAVNRKFAGRR